MLRLLPSLWDGEGAFARAYGDAVRERLIAVYHGAQARWCEAHGIALTGHPAEPDDLATAAGLHWPGQDTVWRWVLPGETSLTGPESTAPKTAASAARLKGAPAVAEVLGAYGWRLTLDESKWLLDWYLSRGVSTLVMHAFYHSVRGGRAYESEPDLGPHNSWWPHFPALVAYTARVAALYESGTHRAATAVLADPEHVPDAPARELLQHQVDFFYLDPARLTDAAIDAGTLTFGDQRFAAVIDLRPAALSLDPEADAVLKDFAASGGLVLGDTWSLPDLKGHLRTAGLAVDAAPAAPGLRVVRFDGPGGIVHACFNEGEDPIATRLTLPAAPDGVQWLDPFTGARTAAEHVGAQIALDLERRQTKVLTGPAGLPDPPAHLALGATFTLEDWTGEPIRSLTAADPVPIGPGDWAAREDLRRFSGTYRYTTDIELPEGITDAVLDLGDVGEAAKVIVNGTEAGDLLWRPYTLTLRGLLRPGANRIELLVSNSAANYYEGARRPSGLIGPVTLAC
ncbi:hypothetical protein E9998_01145 [Glycomyces paridis]|uniref:Glycosyl hydrolases family 2 sugar binding domain-containing protein n=1 Tax=Glycomyces paridis TaxID=2126555 RepID=A0A4S8PML2_9ACTN|nr:hypothetical protein E9998_01145 [Glycomyces paridis]